MFNNFGLNRMSLKSNFDKPGQSEENSVTHTSDHNAVFTADSIVYINSFLFLVDKESNHMIQIRMDNYRPTRPSSLSFNRWKLVNMYPNVEKQMLEKYEKLSGRVAAEDLGSQFISSLEIQEHNFEQHAIQKIEKLKKLADLEDAMRSNILKPFQNLFFEISQGGLSIKSEA